MTITDTTTPTRSRRSVNPHLDEKLLGMLQVPIDHLPQLSAGETGEMYGLIVEGDCMEPLVHSGDHAVVAPGMKYGPGDLVVLWPSDPSKIPLVKRMVMPPFEGWRRAYLHPENTALPVCIVEMLNPRKPLSVDLSKIAAIHRVAAWFGADRVELIRQEDANAAALPAKGEAAMALPSPKPRRQRAPARSPRGRRIDVQRRRARFTRLPPAVDPSVALSALMHVGDFYRVDRQHYLVAPVTSDLLDSLIAAAGATEDDENGSDMEPSLGQRGEDLEADGLEDEIAGVVQGNEAALGWPNEGSQGNLGVPQADEAEPSLGWNNGGPQTRLAAGYSGGMIREGDGDCDDEPDHESGGDINSEPQDDTGYVI